MEVADRSILLMGLPESGKTTFIAALWYFVRNYTGRDALTADVLPAEREYLNRICDAWSKFETQARTKSHTVFDIKLRLRDSQGNAVLDLAIPDISGETFRDNWADRTWSPQFDALTANASRILLFVHPNRISGPVTVAAINAGASDLAGGTEVAGAAAALSKEYVPFDPRKIPSQVMLIDQLQCLIGPPRFHERIRVAIMISAWDEVKAEGLTPSKWFARRVTMLNQFILSNRVKLDVRVFGISAQGGNYENQDDKDRCMQMPNPLSRIDVVDHDGAEANLTTPLLWLVQS